MREQKKTFISTKRSNRKLYIVQFCVSSYIFASLLSLKWFKMLLKYAFARLFIQQIIFTQCWMDNFLFVFHFTCSHYTIILLPDRVYRVVDVVGADVVVVVVLVIISIHISFFWSIFENFFNTHQKHTTLTHWLFTEHQKRHRKKNPSHKFWIEHRILLQFACIECITSIIRFNIRPNLFILPLWFD